MSKKERKRVQKFFDKPSLTHQSFKDESDINQIVGKFTRSSFSNAQEALLNARYADFSEVVDYRTALDLIMQADESFMALPAIVRKRFDNDPAVFLDFVENPDNLDELRELGLANPKPKEPAKAETEISAESD